VSHVACMEEIQNFGHRTARGGVTWHKVEDNIIIWVVYIMESPYVIGFIMVNNSIYWRIILITYHLMPKQM
jgi:hypothetical protein